MQPAPHNFIQQTPMSLMYLPPFESSLSIPVTPAEPEPAPVEESNDPPEETAPPRRNPKRASRPDKNLEEEEEPDDDNGYMSKFTFLSLFFRKLTIIYMIIAVY